HLVANAEAGFEGLLKADITANLGADVGGRYAQGEGLTLSLDPWVQFALLLRAELHAYLKAKVCGFTVLHKDWELGGVDLAEIPFGEFHPFNPIKYNIGGPNPGFLNGLELRDNMDELNDGINDGCGKLVDDSANADAKEKLRPVMQGFKN